MFVAYTAIIFSISRILCMIWMWMLSSKVLPKYRFSSSSFNPSISPPTALCFFASGFECRGLVTDRFLFSTKGRLLEKENFISSALVTFSEGSTEIEVILKASEVAIFCSITASLPLPKDVIYTSLPTTSLDLRPAILLAVFLFLIFGVSETGAIVSSV